MRKIAKIVKQIKEEINDAEKYYESALTSEENDRSVYKQLAEEELEHANKLHNMVVRIINEHKNNGASVPEGMQMVWNYEHEEIVKDVDAIRYKLAKLG